MRTPSLACAVGIACLIAGGSRLAAGQAAGGITDTSRSWAGQRVLLLHGFGDVHHRNDPSSTSTVMGINLVNVVARVEGARLWFRATSGGDSGWVDSSSAVRLTQALAYLDTAIRHDSTGWDLYLRRADVEHALNQRQAATADYSTAISLHPSEAFLYLRRARHYNTLHNCAAELADLSRGLVLAPTSAPEGYNLVAELYSLESGVYASCPDSTLRDPPKALSTIQQAIALDSTRPTFLVILAEVRARSGDLHGAVVALTEALSRSSAAPAYRADWEEQLREFRQALRDSRH